MVPSYKYFAYFCRGNIHLVVDLHELVGLPMTGYLYDEVVPSALELTGVDEKRGRFIPCSYVNSIRPSTFKMASLMANGRRVNLAIPVLASIYEGLNTVATSPKPAELRGPKMTRFSGEGCAKYYEPREARKRIHKAEFVSWACNMLVKAEPFKFVDDGRAEELDHSYFVAIHSSYLTLRQGGRFIIDPYSPHRFGRQFGYYQDVPGTLRYDTRVASLEEGLRYWRLCFYQNLHQKLGSLVCLLMLRNSARKLIKHGGLKSMGHFLMTTLHLEDEVQSIDVGEESETSYSSTMTPPLGMGLRRKQSSPPTAVSVLKVRAYDEARSLSSEKLSQSLHEQQLKEVKARLQDVQAKASEEASEIQSVMDELEHVEEDIAVLKGQRTNLRATLKEKKQLNHDTQAKVHEVEKDLAALESTGPLNDAIVQNLESSRANLGILTEDLKSLNPFA
ncbi:hypothetical protein Sango_2742800 [Sesamum angolense]|uniref:Uncharacterized protein n=1 Tax=Sesamum angolense TaxID=2727404 RepID=A0AAE1W0Z0_9LAMI|nr:hypothetical protein Sango_2742800 [Sesamum angolense]